MRHPLISYIPILTTVLSAVFAAHLWRHWRRRRGARYLFWWFLGLVAYGAGTLTESLTTLLGWHEPIFRAWYITGALLGGAPLAQGTAYLLLPRKVADRLTVILLLVVGVGAALVLASPIHHELVEPYRLSGKVLAWPRVRLVSPFVNLYAVVLLIGGAFWSAGRYLREIGAEKRMWGNIAIAVGAILPGIGGMYTRMGYTEVLYVTELLGLLLIWLGYSLIVRDRGPTIHANQRPAADTMDAT
ncbi:MAG: hypothetical protein ACM357_01805 [Gemmatimonadota bacterium]